MQLEEVSVQCPACWQVQEILIAPEAAEQCFTQDCEVCCRPMVIEVERGPDGRFHALAHSEDDVF